MATVRPPAVAGLFYPGDTEALAAEVASFLAEAKSDGPATKALIAPHAGYVYSGAIAASAYARLAGARGTVTRVVLIGPAHHVSFRGIAVSNAESFATPLGEVPVDRDAVATLRELRHVVHDDEAHAREHSLEVQLPFLQTVLGAFDVVPLVVGDATPEEAAEVLEALWGGPETLIVVSSDLTHYLEYDAARRIDAATSQAIESLSPEDIGRDHACGRTAIQGLLLVAKAHGLKVSTVDLRNSGDTAGPRDQVVGYGAWLLS